MSFTTWISKRLATWVASNQRAWGGCADEVQQQVFKRLMAQSWYTVFGEENGFRQIRKYDDFRQRVPIRSYEDFSGYIDQIKQGVKNVLWPGKPLYLAKTAGTTGGDKYIPITHDAIPHHIAGARNALLHYIDETGNTSFLSHQMIFLSGSPQLQQEAGIPTGRLSGIVNHHVPRYLRKNQLPTYATNCITDWEAKLDQIVEETLPANMGLISGIPPWVQMYFDKLQQRTGKTIGEIFPNFSVLVHGGVRFEPYHRKLFDAIGRKVDTIETYPASEGFIAFQNSQQEEGLLLQLDSGIFFEFIPAASLADPSPKRLWIAEVEVGVDYALVLSTNAGLWAYLLGDTVRFTSLNPHKIVVTGRTKQFISAFGEHVIVEEIEKAMSNVLAQHPQAQVTEYMVAPSVGKQKGETSCHEWFIEFSRPPVDMYAFASDLDKWMCQQNSYYRDLIEGHVLVPLQITCLGPDAFRAYMRAAGKLGEQNKVIRVANNRVIADKLSAYRVDVAQK
jgi:hypothetical protein